MLAPTQGLSLLPEDSGTLTPEPTENMRYLMALCAVGLQIVGTVLIVRSRLRIPKMARRAVLSGGPLLVVVLLVACFKGQHAPRWTIDYFSARTLVAAALIAVASAALARKLRTDRPAARMSASRAGAVLLWVVPLAATVTWVLPGINTERSMAWGLLTYDTAFPFDETFAVINGLTPLVDFNAQYASLFPYATAVLMEAFGKTLLVFTIAMCALTAGALLAVYGIMRRVARHPAVALLLFLPFLATSLFDPYGYGIARLTPGTYFPMLPLRYAGPFFLASLVAWQIDKHPDKHVWLLFGAAGLVVLNNFEFGVAALSATVAAVLYAATDRSRRSLRRLATSAILGLIGALSLYSALALARAGSLPDIARMPRLARLYGLAGYSVAPMPGIIGLPLAIFVTYAAAIATATVRAIDHTSNRVLTGMLAWSGVFGLGTATYYVARSDSILMSMMFPAWALTLVMLTLAALGRLNAHHDRRPSAAVLAVLFGMGLATCSLAQVPFPWREIERTEVEPSGAITTFVPWAHRPPQAGIIRRFVSSIGAGPNEFVVQSGAPIALFRTTGHRTADAYHVVNVIPFTGPDSMHTVGQFEEALDALRAAGGNTVLLPKNRVWGLHEALERRGFRLLTRAGVRNDAISEGDLAYEALTVGGLTKWVDMTRPRAPWLD